MALTILTDWLKRLGLEGLVGWAQEQLTDGASEDEIAIELYDQPEFITRFPAIRDRARRGLPVLSVDAYLQYESFASQVAKSFGITLSKVQTDEMLKQDVSTKELEDRVGMAAKAVYQSPPELRESLSRLYNVQTGDLINYWLDPKEQLPILQRKFAAAQISSEAEIAGYRNLLTAEQAESLFEGGVQPEGAREAFGQLVQAEELFEAVDVTEEDIDVEDQLGLLRGEAGITQQVERRGQKRVAKFQEGGEFAQGRTGIGGLGSAATS